MPKQRLELNWIGKDVRPRLEPRILIEDAEKSYHAPFRVSDTDIYDNMLIHGDNLLALKALEQEFRGKVKCIYIDPPYNTGSAFEHYDDGIEHSLWLSLMRDRIELLRNLLSEDGSLWVSLDEHEHAYFKVMCDELFGRKNFITNAIWQKKYAAKSDSKLFSESHDYIMIFAKNIDVFRINRMPKTEKQTSRYTNRDNDPRGPWKAGDVLRNEVRDYAVFEVELPSGEKVLPPYGTSWRYTKEKFAEMIEDNRIWFGIDGSARPAVKRFLREVADTMPPVTIWPYDEVGHNDEAKKESKTLFQSNLFTTPKPERLIQRILHIATNPGDLVLDSFLGSGTTAAVAHKMGRRWIGIELGEHCYTHCVPRLQKVINGEDQGGISQAMQWQGGGGFRFYDLGPSLIKTDKWGNAIINKEFNGEMLAQALCKLSGYVYMPDSEIYWMQGQGSEADYMYATTQFLSAERLITLNEEVGDGRSLLVYCTAFRLPEDADALNRLTVRKIPKSILAACEWDRDDYSLNIQNLPQAEVVIPQEDKKKNKGKKAQNKNNGQSSLLDMDDE